MKRVASALLAVVACGLLGANLLISQDAALVGGALATLKFESAPAATKAIGGPPRYKISKATLDYLAQHRKRASSSKCKTTARSKCWRSSTVRKTIA
jgi:hypothetical protein